MQKSNIVLIGMMGTAKTSAGKAVARKKNMLFFDSDAMFEEKFGSISAFFDRYGEGMFRVEESKIIYELSRKENALISCGGGTVLNPANMSALKRNAAVVLLTASNEVIYERVKNDSSRPLLMGDALKNIAKLQQERAPLYKKYADYTVCTDTLSVEDIADRIIALL